MNKKTKIVIGVIAALVVSIVTGAVIMFNAYYNKMNYEERTTVNVDEESVSSMLQEEIDEENGILTEPIKDSDEEEIKSVEEQILENIEKNKEDLIFSENVFNILLIGTDHRAHVAGSRSDAMMVLSINKETKKMVLTSFMRDMYVEIPGKGNNRLNAAYAYGGADLLIKTLESNFGMKIDRYAHVDFYAFINVIDTLGGVEIEVSEAERKCLNDYIKELNMIEGIALETDALDKTGLVQLNGKQALSFARIRYVGNSDFGRTERQRNILLSAFNKVKNSGVIELNNLLNSVLPEVTTDISQGECLSLLLNMPEYASFELVSNRVPYDKTYSSLRVNGMAVLGVDFEKNIENLKRDIYGMAEDSEAVKTSENSEAEDSTVKPSDMEVVQDPPKKEVSGENIIETNKVND